MKLLHSQKKLKTSILILFFYVFSMNCAMADTCTGDVTIPDDAFKTELLAIAGLDANHDDVIQCSEASAYNGSIEVNGLGIADLTGVEAFTNITSLDCSGNSLTSLDVSNNTALTTLYCNNNSLPTLDVSSNTDLQYLYCYNNSLMSLNVKNGNNTSLLEFNATGNPDLSCILVDDVAYMNSNFSGNINGLEGFSENCSCVVNIPDDNFRSYLLNSPININSDGIIDCSEASAYTGSIDVSVLSITDLTGIEAFTNITSLDCSSNLLTSLNVSANAALTQLRCQYNQLTNLNTTGVTTLNELRCANNQLASLDISTNTALTLLDCANNQLASLGISTNTALTALGCSNNQLTSLVVSGNTDLSKLRCANNQLASLDISTNTALTALGCSNNQLSSLDVSANTALTILHCQSNSLTSLNVKNGNNSILTDFDATSNPDLSCIQVDDAAFSTDNWSYDGSESFSTDCACIVTIPDPYFKAALVENTDININGDGEIQCFEASAYTGAIDVSSQSISDLTGIEAFTNITSLNCSNNSLEGLDVSSNTALEYLYCNNNLLTGLNVSSLTSLNYFFCQNNQLASLDVSSNTQLYFLFCNDNFLTTLNTSSMPYLLQLHCFNNNITSLDFFGLTSLYEIDCSNNKLPTLDVSSNKALQTLHCNSNYLRSLNLKNDNNSILTDFDATSNPDLTCIQIDGGGVDYSAFPWTNIDVGASYSADCACIVNIPDAYFKAALIATGIDINGDGEIQCFEASATTYIDVTNAGNITDLTGIEAFTALTELDCPGNLLTTLDVSSNTALLTLDCSDNSLSTLDVLSNTALTSLTCNNNSLTTLNVSSNTVLDYLSCTNNSLTNLNVSSLASLYEIDCSDNQLTTLDVSSNTSLDYLTCSNNSLKSLDVSSNIALEYLECNDNSLTSLDVSYNTALGYLYCSNNSLTSLNVKNGTNITEFDATSNPDLTCIQVDDADYMNSNFSGGINGIESFSTDCGADLTWTGATSTSWGTPTNWDNGFVPSVSNNITIPDATNAPIIGSTTTAYCNNITVESESGASLTIESSESGTGSLIVSGTSTGTVTAERYMTENKWHLVSPITTGGSISTFIQAAGNEIPLSSSNYGMMDYNETSNAWNSYFTSSTSETFTSAKGYGIRRSSDGVVTFTGTLTTGTNTVAITKGGTAGWNLIGNPYSSAIYMNTAANATYNFLKTNAIDAAKLDASYACIYLWDATSSTYKILGNTSYSGRDLDITVFAPGQAFFVKAASAGTLEFNNNMQVHQTGAMFKARASTLSWPGITLTASSIATSSSAIITFNDNMTNGLDPTYDAGLLRGTNGLSLYTRLLEDNGVDFAVQCLPENYNNLVIPVGVDCRDGGEITFNAQTVDLPAACNVILEDRTTKTFTTLTGGATYKTTVLAGTTDIGRFYIRTGDNFTTGTLGLTAAICNLKAYTVNGAIIIEGEVSDQAIATLYDLQGLKVLVHSLQKGSLNILSCPDIMNGIYLLTIQQDGEIVTRKLIMK